MDDFYDNLDDGADNDNLQDAEGLEVDLGEATGALLLSTGQVSRRKRVPVGSGGFFFAKPPDPVDVKSLFPKSDHLTKPQVCAVIADVRLGTGKVIDLIKFASCVRNVEVHPTRKTAILRLNEPKCSVAIRMCGVLTITGCKNVMSAKSATRIVCKIIRRAMDWTAEDLSSVQFSIHTTTVRFDLKQPIRLESLAHNNPKYCSYEPESFCGATVRMSGVLLNSEQHWSVTASAFASGKVVLVGACSAPEVLAAYNAVLPILAKEAVLPPVAKKNTANNKNLNNDNDDSSSVGVSGGVDSDTNTKTQLQHRGGTGGISSGNTNNNIINQSGNQFVSPVPNDSSGAGFLDSREVVNSDIFATDSGMMMNQNQNQNVSVNKNKKNNNENKNQNQNVFDQDGAFF